MSVNLTKKIDTAKKTIAQNIGFLRCPICRTLFGFENLKYSLSCQNGHTYDISKKGYVNLFNGYTKVAQTYGKDLFIARKTVSDAGLYDKLLGSLYADLPPGAVLDAGCGCGNLTAGIFENTGRPPTFALDLSKDGIGMAASGFCGEGLLWIVGNINDLPLQSGKFGVILNILSPANYSEFIRVLKPGGVLVKVLPDSDYLKELRRFIYGESDKNEYSNGEVMANLEKNMPIAKITDVKYTHTVKSEHIPALFDMTPLTQNIPEREKKKKDLSAKGDLELTLAFKIAVCEKY